MQKANISHFKEHKYLVFLDSNENVVLSGILFVEIFSGHSCYSVDTFKWTVISSRLKSHS